jgi:hypothetical protein
MNDDFEIKVMADTNIDAIFIDGLEIKKYDDTISAYMPTTNCVSYSGNTIISPGIYEDLGYLYLEGDGDFYNQFGFNCDTPGIYQFNFNICLFNFIYMFSRIINSI